MNIVGLYGGSGFIGSHFQSMLNKISNDTEVFLLPHRKSNNEIKSALNKALYDKKFKLSIKKINNPYGKGNSARKIVKILKEISLDNLIQKKFID